MLTLIFILTFFQIPSPEVFFDEGAKRVAFTPEELAFIQEKKELKLGIDPNWMPFESFDEDGNYTGISSDFYHLFSRISGLKFTVVKTESWGETLQKAKNRDIDLVSMAALTPDRQQYLSFSSSYLMEVESVVATLFNRPSIENLSEIPGKSIGVIRGYSHVETLGNRYPEIRIVEIEDYHEGLLKVISGELYGLAGNMASIGYAIQEYRIQNVKIAGTLPEMIYLRVASRNDIPILASIMEKLVGSISTTEKKEIINKWVGIRYETVVDYSLLWKIALSAGVIIVGFGVWILVFRKLNSKLHESNTQLEELNRQKDYYLSVIAHDLRNPFMIIQGYSNVLMEDFDRFNKDEIRSYVARINDSAEMIQDMLDNLLEWAKIELNKIDHTKVPVDLHATVKNISGLLKDSAAQKNITFSNEIPVAYIKEFDKHMITTILRNLMSNAVKYSKVGQVIKVGVHPIDGYLWVKDSGIGMDRQLQESIFSSEPQKSRPGTQSEKGTGLGLVICNRYAQEMGMRLTVDSNPDEGSTFKLHFDAA